jgi:membrane protein
MSQIFPAAFSALKATWRAFNDDKATRLAASIAYATMFSLAPLFVVLIAIAGAVLGATNGGHGHHIAEERLLASVRGAAGTEAAQTLRGVIAAAFNKPRQSAIAQVVGWVGFVFGASALFAALQDALNAVWGVEATHRGWRHMLRDRLASFGMIAVVGFLLLVSFAANTSLAFAGAHFASLLPLGPAVMNAAGWLVSLGLITVVFATLFKVLPDIDIAWSEVWFGAFATAVLFVIGQAAIAVYFSVAGVASAYGAAGSLLAVLLWVYYSAAILLFGAEFTKVRARRVRTTIPTDPRHAL